MVASFLYSSLRLVPGMSSSWGIRLSTSVLERATTRGASTWRQGEGGARGSQMRGYVSKGLAGALLSLSGSPSPLSLTLTSPEAAYHSRHAAMSCTVGTALSTAASTRAHTSGSDPGGCEATWRTRSGLPAPRARPSTPAEVSRAACKGFRAASGE